jgi:hypothetical protein
MLKVQGDSSQRFAIVSCSAQFLRVTVVGHRQLDLRWITVQALRFSAQYVDQWLQLTGLGDAGEVSVAELRSSAR